MARYRTPTRSDWIKTCVYTGLLCAAAVAGGIFLQPTAYLLLVTAGLMVLVQWHTATSAYRCTFCGHEFAISPWQDFLSPYLLDSKYLHCPNCRHRHWAEVLKRV